MLVRALGQKSSLARRPALHDSSVLTRHYEKRLIDKMTKFRPCIDLHAGAVKQIVGGTLTTTSADLQTNFTSEHAASFYADLYKKHDLRGGHVIMLGPGNDQASKEALSAWPGGLQVGGGIKDSNAQAWIDAGAEKVGRPCTPFLDAFVPQRWGPFGYVVSLQFR